MTTGEVDEGVEAEVKETTDKAEETTKEDSEKAEEPAAETEEAEEETDEEADEESEEPAGKDDTDGDEPAAKPVGRAQARIQRQAAELKAERAEKEKLIAERAVAQAQLENLRQQQNRLQSDQQRREEEAKLALLTPEEKQQYQSQQHIRNLEHRLNQMEVGRANDRDRAEFHAKAAHDETYAKYSDTVEQMYNEGLARGVHASREDLFCYVLGKALNKDRTAKIADKKKAAGKRIDSVTAKPANAKGDVAGTKKGKSEEDRLRGVLI